MKALVYTGPGHLVYRDEPDPLPGEDDVLLRVDAAGICGSDLHTFLGHDERRPPPLIPGHEVSGHVVGGPLDGRRFVVNPLVGCGRCEACLADRQNLCGRREILSMPPRQGAFAGFLVIPGRNLVPVPDGMDMSVAALAEPIATAWHAVAIAGRLSSRPLAGSRALVLGGGAIGLAAALCLHAHGCSRILLAETNPARRRTVAGTGVCTPVDPAADGNPVPGGEHDVVIDCVGAPATREMASAAACPGGVIVHVGLADGRGGLDIRRLTLQEITLAGSYTYTMADFRATVAAMHAGRLGALDWYDERPLAGGPGAFADLLGGRVPSAKIILRPG